MSRQISDQTRISPPRLTYEQFLEWDGENQHVEWVNGEVVPMAPISSEHQTIAGFLIALLKLFVEGANVGVVLFDPFQMKTGPDLPGRAPDVVFIFTEHLSRLKKNYLEGPADLVVEIISPDSRTTDRRDKFSEYEQGGVPEYWVIDPIRKKAEFYQRDGEGRYRLALIGADDVYRSAVLPGHWIKTGWLWRRPLLMDVLREWKLV